jgi:hypothetical protein
MRVEPEAQCQTLIPVDERAFRRLLPVPETESSASAEEFGRTGS